MSPDNDSVFEVVEPTTNQEAVLAKLRPVGSVDGTANPRSGERGGSYSPDGRYRWSSARLWSSELPACWVGLNPGTGDSDGKPRPTLRKMIAWSQRWSGGEIVIVNLFAFRTTNPRALYAAARQGLDIVGDRNDDAIREASRYAI